MNSSDIPTPETDAAAVTIARGIRFINGEPVDRTCMVPLNVSRSLERRLAIAVEALKSICYDEHHAKITKDALAQLERMKGTM